MTIKWVSATLFSSMLIVGCGGGEPENTPNFEQTEETSVTLPAEAGDPGAVAPPAPAQAEVSSRADAPAPRRDSPARPTTGTQPRAAAPPVEAPRPVERAAESPRRDTRPEPPPVRIVTLPVGTVLPLELTEAVSTETATIEMPVSARLRSAVTVDGVTVLPADASVRGEVVDVQRPGRTQGRARLGLRFTSVVVGGERIDLRTNPVMVEGEATRGEDATKIGAGAGIGAIIGGIAGGGSGAAKGAAIGGAAGTAAVLATRGKDIELAAGSDVTATLASALEVER